MDIKIIIIGSILVIICVLPFIFVGRGRKKKEQKLLQTLFDFANRNDCSISEHEICGDILIGVDESNLKLFFMKQMNQEVITQLVNLKEFQTCKVKNTSRGVMSTSVIEKLELVFIPKDKTKKEVALEFFNSDHSIQIVDELHSIEKWCNKINGLIG
jgi:hypothetical protein